MRRSLVASSALFLASVCAILGVHTTHIFYTVLGAPIRAFLWPLATLGILASAALIWLIHTALRRNPVQMRILALAPRTFTATALFTGMALPWYVSLAETPFDELPIIYGSLAAAGYCLLLSATMPFIVNSIFRLSASGRPKLTDERSDVAGLVG